MNSSSPQAASTLVVFSHGKESGPNGRKIQALSRLAESEGAQTLAIDYREHPEGVKHDPNAPEEAERRVAQLLSTPLPVFERLVLVGSSMGGYVSAVAACQMRVDGLFLLAPAMFMPGYAVAEPRPTVLHKAVVHGWRDEVIPWQNSVRWAAATASDLHLIDGDHRLDSAVPHIEPLFRAFMKAVQR